MEPLYDRERLASLKSAPGVRHRAFGDLNRADAVRMPPAANGSSYVERSPFFVHVSVTGRCYARCKGCINACVTHHYDRDEAPAPIADIDGELEARGILDLLAMRGARDAVVCLYGGEPLLAVDRIAALEAAVSRGNGSADVRYMLYTNGEMILSALRAHPALMRRIWLYSVSIDGTEAQHDAVRLGTSLARVHENLEGLKREREGQVLMWSTLREEQSLADCMDEFRALERRGLAEHFFWHWVETDEPFASLPGFMARYERDLAAAMEAYVEALRAGRVLSVVHVSELLLYMLAGRARGTSACGVERAENYDIADGKVFACADLPPETSLGWIDADGAHVETADLASLVDYKRDLGCYECGVHAYCGGRCPVEALTSRAERLVEYCQLMRLHVGVVAGYAADAARAMRIPGISLQDLYDRSAYYAQFTDVTP